MPVAAHTRARRRRRLLRDLVAFAVFGALVVGFVVQGALRLNYDWQWERVLPYLWRTDDEGWHAGVLLQGLVVTLQIVALALVATLAIGLACALLQRSGSPVARAVVRGYIEASRNTPLLVQLFLIYFVVAPLLGVDRFAAGVIGLALYEGAFAAEIFRAGIESVPKGQWEAARALSLSRADTYRRIVIPQSIRLILPPLTNLTVSLIKDSTLVSVIAVAELMTTARDVVSETFMAFEVWFTVAAIYLVLTTSFSLAARRTEDRLKLTRNE